MRNQQSPVVSCAARAPGTKMVTASSECAADELARVTYELERVEEGRRRLRAALAEQRAAADEYAARAEADARAEAGAISTSDFFAAHGQLLSTLRTRLDATSAEEDARAHDLCATVAALRLTAALASVEHRCMMLPSPVPAAASAPSSEALGLLGSWVSWMAETPEAKLAADIAEVRQQLSHVKSLVQETSLSSLLARVTTLLERQSAPTVEPARALQEHATMAAGCAVTAREGPSRPKDDVTPERTAQRLLDLVGSAAGCLEQVASHRADAAREMRTLAWHFRTLPLHQSVNGAPPAMQAELQAQAREAALSSELLTIEQRLLFCAAPVSDQLAANATAEQNAGVYRSRACNAERQLADARAGMAAVQKRAVAAEELAETYKKQLDEASATVNRRARKPRPRLDETPELAALVAQPGRKLASQITDKTSPLQGGEVPAAQADSARALEVGGRPNDQSEAQLPRKAIPANGNDMD